MRAPRPTRVAGLRAVRATIGAVLACCLAVLLTGCNQSITPPTGTGDQTDNQAQAAQAALVQLAQALDSGRTSAPDLTSSAAPSLVPAILANGRALQVGSVEFQYVDDDAGALSSAARARFGNDAWVGDVQATYRLPMDPGPSTMEIAITFATSGGHTRIAAVGGYGRRSPLWMLGPATIIRAGRTLVIVSGPPGAAYYSRLAQVAVRRVNLVLPDWRGNLIVEVPRDKAELDSMLQAGPDTYTDIAGVTTTVGGSLRAGTPIHVYLNPEIFTTLKLVGAQMVMTHESTHVATQAPLSSLPTWLAEGFADYVALAHAGVPVRTAAAQILAQMRKQGVPTHLPTPQDLSPTAPGLGATYEEAWLVCHYFAQAYGEQRLVAFYRTVNSGRSVATAFPKVLGISEASFVAGWRAAMARLAGVHLAG